MITFDTAEAATADLQVMTLEELCARARPAASHTMGRRGSLRARFEATPVHTVYNWNFSTGTRAVVAGLWDRQDQPTGSTAQAKAAEILKDAARRHAIKLRRKWMAAMGMDQSEIDAHCGPNAQADLAVEIENYEAMLEIHKMNKQADAR